MFSLWETLPVASIDDSFSFALAFYEGVSSSRTWKLSKALAKRSRGESLYLDKALVYMMFITPAVEIIISIKDGDCILHLERWK